MYWFLGKNLCNLYSPFENLTTRTTIMLGSAWGVKLYKDKVRLKWRKAWKDGFQDGDGLMWKARNLTGN